MKFLILFLAITMSTTTFAAKKNKKKTLIKATTNLTEQANLEINEQVKLVDKIINSDDSSGILAVQTQANNDIQFSNNYDLGFSVSNLQTLGFVSNKKNTGFDLAQISQPYVAQLDFYKNLSSFSLFQKVGFHLGFNQFYAQSSSVESVLVSQSYFQISTSRALWKQQKNEIDFISHLGFLNFQAASSENAFLNINSKTNYLGAGLEYSYQVNQKLKLYTNALYRSKIQSQTDLQLKTLAGTLGASYLW